MKVFSTIAFLICVSQVSFAEVKDKTQVFCEFGNALAEQGPVYKYDRSRRATLTKIKLGDFWKEEGQIVSASTSVFRYGTTLTANELRADWGGRDEKTDEQLIEMQKEHPSSIEFEVSAELINDPVTKEKGVRVSFGRLVNAYGLHMGGGEFGERSKAFISYENFGKPNVLKDVGIVCTGKIE